MGAVVGAFYAAGYPVKKIEKILINESVYKILGFSWKKAGLLKMDKLKDLLQEYLPHNISDLEKPFYVGLTNLNKGSQEIYNSGPLYDYLIAACSAPGIFAPFVIKGNSYVDGGLLCNLPASAIRDKCEVLIGAHVNYPGIVKTLDDPKKILKRTVELGINQNTKPEKELCDYLIDPPAMQNYTLVDFKKSKEIIEVGYRHTIRMLTSGKLQVGEMV